MSCRIQAAGADMGPVVRRNHLDDLLDGAGRRQAYLCVDLFERALARYMGAPHVVAVGSGTDALFLSLLYFREHKGWWQEDADWPFVVLPKRTAPSVAQAARNAKYWIDWHDVEWVGAYDLHPMPLYDACLRFTADMYVPGSLMCVSFAASKRLAIGRGGAILTDSAEADAWLRRARFSGRTEGKSCDEPDALTRPGWAMGMTPDEAARGLLLLTHLPTTLPDLPASFPDLSTQEAFK